nr:DUF4349 domain-containing protein [Lachnospiraceae bacterium]
MINKKIMNKQTISKAVVLLLIAASVTGCGKGYSSKSADSVGSYKQATVENSRSGYANNSFDDGANYSDEEYAASSDQSSKDSADSSSENGESTDQKKSTNKLDAEKLIYKCNFDIETLKFKDTINEFRKLIDKYDAFIESEETYNDDSYNYNSYGLGYYTATIRVPSSKYNGFINETDGIGTLKSKSQNVTNVSQEYSDLTIELEVLEAQKDDYLEMLKEAKSLKDMENVITISDKITSVSTKINQIKTRLNEIDNDVAYSFVTVNICEVKEIVEYTEDSFGTRFKREVKQGWYDFAYGLQNFIINIVANIWSILLFFGVVILGFFIIKKFFKKIIKLFNKLINPTSNSGSNNSNNNNNNNN